MHPGNPPGGLVAPDSPAKRELRGRTDGRALGRVSHQTLGNVYGPIQPSSKVVSGLGVFRRERFR